MEKAMSARTKIRIASFSIFTVLVLSIFAVAGNVRASRSAKQLEVVSERALADLDDYVNNMQTSLEKGIYANTAPMLSKMAMQLSREATGAKSMLTVLPLREEELQNTYKFLAQLSDFVLAMQKKEEMGETLTEKERAELFRLLDYAKTLSKEISEIRHRLFSGEIVLETAHDTLSVGAEKLPTLSQNAQDTEQAFTEYPTLIYDGPFSDHMSSRESMLLKHAEPISRTAAQEKAASLLGIAPNKLKFTSEEEDASQSYRFTDGKASVAITKRGGYLLYLLSSDFAGESKMRAEEGLPLAKAFLEQNGYKSMKETYYAVHDGICTYNFAYQNEDYICYPDLIKVSVSLEDGKILSADCRSYIANHHSRTPQVPKLSQAAAQKKLSPLLSPLEVRLAVIPTKGGSEQEVYEFHCKSAKDEELLVYIDTQTGVEDDILLLLYEDDGVLTK